MKKEGAFGEEFTTIEELLTKLANARKENIRVSDYPKLEMMCFSFRAIQKAIADSGIDVKVTCGYDQEPPPTGYISVEGREIDISDTEWFCRAAEFANNTEAYPLTEDRIRMTFTFYRVFTKPK